MKSPKAIEIKALRHFGWIVGSVFLLIGVWPYIRGTDINRIWAIAIATPLIVLGTFAPKTLAGPHRLWMIIGNLLGWLNTRIILGVFYYLLLVPIGLLLKLLKRDELLLFIDRKTNSYRIASKLPKKTHFERMF